MEKEYKYKVATLCKTFQHSLYIEDALNGFSIQQTTFPCVFVIIDDASTDGEPNILRRWAEENLDLDTEGGATHEHFYYGERYVAYLKNKPNLLFVIILLSENHHGKKSKLQYCSEWIKNAKYRALCEGDDYWIESTKLQKQYDFLENHKDYCMCYTNFNIFLGSNNVMHEAVLTNLPQMYPKNYTLEEWICRGGYMGPMTWMIRQDYIAPPQIKSRDKTFILFASFLSKSKVYCLDNCCTAVYRCINESASHSKNLAKLYAYTKNVKEVRIRLVDYYKEYINDTETLKHEIEKRYYRNKRNVWLILINQDKEEAYKCDLIYYGRKKLFSYIVNHANICNALSFIYPIMKRIHWLFYRHKYNK